VTALVPPHPSERPVRQALVAQCDKCERGKEPTLALHTPAAATALKRDGMEPLYATCLCHARGAQVTLGRHNQSASCVCLDSFVAEVIQRPQVSDSICASNAGYFGAKDA
jgi:hypothetical protein